MAQWALTIKGLTKRYKNNVYALKNINLRVAEGDFFALLGPNGAGKTTLIGIVSGLVKKTQGQLSVLGNDIDLSPTLVKRKIGIVPQEFNFHIFEQVQQILIDCAGYYGVSRRLAKDRACYWLKILGLWEKRHQLSRNLSGGMKRRLMIARAMMHDPNLLILDEPTAGVDISMRYATWELLKTINSKGITIILTTHYLEEAENLCKHVGIIKEGRLVENTTIQALLQKTQTETFVLDLEHPLQDKTIIDSLGLSFRWINEKTLELDRKETQSINTLIAFLSRCNIQVRSLRNKANRLEQLFIQMTQNDSEL